MLGFSSWSHGGAASISGRTMSLRRAGLALAFGVMVAPAITVGQESPPTFEFSFSNPGARSLGLGGAFAALADDATAAFANPAGLVQLASLEISAELRHWRYSTPYIEGGRYDAARDVVMHSDAAVSRILGYGLTRAERSGSNEEIQMAMEEGLLEVVPRLERRTHYLATLANIATLLGLLGTIIGLTEAFSTVAAADPADKANLLSASISIAMNTTAFGLIVAIPLLLVHAVMQTKTAELVDNLEMVTVRLSNLVVGTGRS